MGHVMLLSLVNAHSISMHLQAHNGKYCSVCRSNHQWIRLQRLNVV